LAKYHDKKVSIEDEEKNSTANIFVFPNPINNFLLTVNVNIEKFCNLQMSLYDLNGKLLQEIFTGAVESGLFIRTIETGHLARGVYLLDVWVDGEFYAAEKIVVD